MAEKNDKDKKDRLAESKSGEQRESLTDSERPVNQDTQTQGEQERPLVPPDEVPIDDALKDEPDQPLAWETSMELLASFDEDEAMIEEMNDYTASPEVLADFAERQELDTGAHLLRRRLEEHHSLSPDISADDIDAAWDEAGVGEETVGGTAPTPDQDQVDEIGEAAGLTYEDDEPLHTGDKLAERDRHRWELNPESADDEDELEEEDNF
jgi:hypothetical protein